MSILDRIVTLKRTARLNILLEQEPRQEAQAQLAWMCSAVIQIYRVDDLRLGNVNVDDAKVLLEAVADKDTAQVDE